MTSEPERPPLQADERTALVGRLDLQRRSLRWKCEGLSDEDAHRSVVPTSPAMTMAGLVSHMRWAEHTWLEVLFLGGDEKLNPSFDESSEDADCTPTAAPSPNSSRSTRPSDGLAARTLLHVVRRPTGRGVGCFRLPRPVLRCHAVGRDGAAAPCRRSDRC